MKDLKGQDTARREMEIAATGGHNLLIVGPPGAGKSLLAAELTGLLPVLSAAEALRITMLHSVAGRLVDGGLIQARPFVSRIIWRHWRRLLAVGHEPVWGKFRWRIMVCCFWMNWSNLPDRFSIHCVSHWRPLRLSWPEPNIM